MEQNNFHKGAVQEALDKLENLDEGAQRIAAFLRERLRDGAKPSSKTKEDAISRPQQKEAAETEKEPWGAGAGLPRGDR